MDDIIELIREAKRKCGMTTSTLSAKSGIPLGTLNKILSGETRSVKAYTLHKLAKVLGIDYLGAFSTDEADECKRGDIGLVKVQSKTFELALCDVEKNYNSICKCVVDAVKNDVKILVFPELCLTGYTVSDLFYQGCFLSDVENYLIKLKAFSSSYNIIFFVGAPLEKDGKLYNTAVAICNGEILGVVPKTHIPNYNEFYEKRHFCPAENSNSTIIIGEKEYPFGTKLIFCDKDKKQLKIAVEICEDLWTTKSPSIEHALNGATVIVNLSASDELIGKAEYRKSLISFQSSKCVCGYIYADAGKGESCTDMVFAGHDIIAENGKILSESEIFGNGDTIAEIDVDFIEYERKKLFLNGGESNTAYQRIMFSLPIGDNKTFIREYEKMPFVPSSKDELEKRVNLILDIQSEGLSRRISHINCKKVVIGVSGGLDSTLALIVACRALDKLNRPHSDVVAITMPCFGTTSRTKDNSIKLARILGTTFIEIDISKTVRSHFFDIDHDEKITDITYENSQARERTQVLMDYANKVGGIVVGTGDLSELALGWATYNGDHMSMYGVNCSIPKTLIRFIIANVAKNSGCELKCVLNDILYTPVSPELIPAKDGEISQKTEDIVGPYILHDFYLYYMLRMGFSPSKIYRIAIKTFKNDFSKDEIYKWLQVFIKRFFANQFKRSCLPDGVKVGSVSLSPRGDWRMPSDANCNTWLKDLESVKNY